MLLVKIYGIVDLVSALILIYWPAAPVLLKVVLVIILLIKGLPSLFADLIGKFYGFVDILTAVVFISTLSFGFFNIFLAAVLIFKGLFSLL